MTLTCPDEDLLEALDAAARGGGAGLAAVSALLDLYPGDARLHFLKGSLQAGAGEFALARMAMAQAVELAPDYGIARFQLGFVDYTSGDPASAESVWQPLLDAEEGDPLRLFVEGLTTLARDEFEPALALLRRGIEANSDNAPLNADMRRLIDAIEAQTGGAPESEEPLSLAQLALQQSAARSTRH